jgi:phosphohistidine phosphatase
VATQLWLLRHGEAEPHDARPDPDRRLTERGEAQSRAAGAALRALELNFHLVLTSPKVRALDTARLACEELGADEPVVHQPLAEGFDGRAALEAVALAGPDQRVLVVGHNPDFEQVVYDLTGGRAEVKKGGVAGIRLDGRRGELLAMLRPRELERISAAS